ncbi:ABC transporter ATP-binding protein [Candidatus Pacearchaeota archaeon]|nr:ABC transporter ATP-binding protein [Candidatus Pacearchaeota archaeon]
MKEKTIPIKERFESLKLAIGWTYKSSKTLTFIIFAVAIFGGLLTIVEPYIFKLIIDYLTKGSSLSLTEKFSVGISGILLIYGVARITQSMLWDIQTIIKRVHSQKLDLYVSKIMMNKISSLDMQYFENPNYYNTLTKANQNIWRVNEFLWQFTFLISQLIGVIVIIGALMTLNWIIVLLIIAAALPSIILIFKKTKLVWGIFDSYSPVSRQSKYYMSLMTERPDAIKELRLYGLKSFFIKRFGSLSEEFVKKQERAAKNEFATYTLIGIIEVSLSVIAAWMVVSSFTRGEISLGELTFFWALLFQFSEHARWIVRLAGEINEHTTFISPFVKIMNFKPLILDSKHPKKFPNKLKTGIEFKNVSFAYPGTKDPTLKNLNLIIKPDESVALIGENGSGKTTLIKLLCRLYDVTEGEILIDGINIKEYSLDELYENLGVIFQDFMQYEGLIEENIGFGKLKELKKKEKIHHASIKAEAWNFIKSLEEQYKTHLGKTLKDKGKELSIGQWQKIALARAFFRDANILILDEPTAAVDAKAEYRLFQKFKHLTKNKTTILISHRFSTVRMADKIIVMNKGRITEQGNHSELLRKKGAYAHLFNLQAKSYR